MRLFPFPFFLNFPEIRTRTVRLDFFFRRFWHPKLTSPLAHQFSMRVSPFCWLLFMRFRINSPLPWRHLSLQSRIHSFRHLLPWMHYFACLLLLSFPLSLFFLRRRPKLLRNPRINFPPIIPQVKSPIIIQVRTNRLQ